MRVWNQSATSVPGAVRASQPSTGLEIGDGRMDGPHGTVPIRRYRPQHDGIAALMSLVWLHGGSFLSGDLDMPEADVVARRLAAAGIQVVTVDYRLAPVPAEFAEAAGGLRGGVHYPVAVEEIEQVFLQLVTESGHGWSLGGASAGGALAASVTARLTAADGPAPDGLVLVYPLLHHELPSPAAELVAALADAEVSPTKEEVAVMNRNYLGRDCAEEDIAGAFPGDGSVAAMPPTLIIDSEIDVLRASSQRFAADLVLAGREVTYVVEPGTHHGHLNRSGSDSARSVDRVIRWMTSHCNSKDIE